MTLKLIYDATVGYAHRDGEAENVVKEAIELHGRGVPTVHELITGTDNVLNQLRVAVFKRQIAASDVEIVFRKRTQDKFVEHVQDTALRIDRDGRIEHWPEGFADYTDKLHEILLGWNND